MEKLSADPLAEAELEGTTVSLRELRDLLNRLAESSPAQEGFVRAVWEALLAEVEARDAVDEADEGEGIDYSDLPALGNDDAYWTGGRVGPVLPAGTARRPS